MNRKELEDQMRNILIPVAPHGWLIDQCCDLAELYARQQLLQQTPCTTLLPVDSSTEDEYCKCEYPTLGKSVSRCGTCDCWFKPIA